MSNNFTSSNQDILLSGKDQYPLLSDAVGITDYYLKYGYVVIRNVIPENECKSLILNFIHSVKNSKSHFYRQTASGLAEVHRFNHYNMMMNSILNIQDLNKRYFDQFIMESFKIFTNYNLIKIVSDIFSISPTIVQTMYFEGNPATWAHQDTYYLESSNPKGILAGWIALEDIDETAGRFYIYPKSHLIELPKNSGNLNFSFNHDEYKNHVLNIIKENKLEISIPRLNAGDILLWSSKTIHGSMRTTDSKKSRNSLTVHFMPSDSNLIAFQAVKRKLRIRKINNIDVHCPKPLDLFKYRMILEFERKFPKLYSIVKKQMIGLFTR
jgi:phytanoyl-CoA hydroxylase